MPLKGGGGKKGGKKKKKKQQLSSKPEHLHAFGVKVGDMIRTPLGVPVCVLGVRANASGSFEAGRLMVEYVDSKLRGPLEPTADALAGMALQDMGYTVLQGAELLQYKLDRHQQSMQSVEEQRYLQEAAAALHSSAAVARKKVQKGTKKPKSPAPEKA